MAAKSKQPVEDSEEEQEDEYEVEAIKKHRRKGKLLEYYVSWVGYPSEEEGNDSWITEESAEGAPDMVNKYWKSLPAAKQAERFAPGSAKALAAAKPASSARVSGSKRSLSREEPSPANKRSKASASKGNGTPGSEKKKARKEDSPELSLLSKPKKKTKRIVEDDEEETPDDDASPAPQGEDRDVDGRSYCAHHEGDFAQVKDWEPLVANIETIEQDSEGKMRLFVIWKNDNTFAWVNSALIRERCPQKLIDFYESHLKFSPTEDSDDEA